MRRPMPTTLNGKGKAAVPADQVVLAAWEDRGGLVVQEVVVPVARAVKVEEVAAEDEAVSVAERDPTSATA